MIFFTICTCVIIKSLHYGYLLDLKANKINDYNLTHKTEVIMCPLYLQHSIVNNKRTIIAFLDKQRRKPF